jgi:hypothetical protein
MENLTLEATNSTPEIQANYSNNTIEIRGKSYPENTFEFYQLLMDWVEAYFKTDQTKLKLTFEIQYFNSSTSKVFYDLFDLLEESRTNGKSIVVDWEFDPENVSAEEAGEDFKEDFEDMEINLVGKP